MVRGAVAGRLAGREQPVDAEIAASLADIGDATRRLLATTATVSDAQARGPSLLPGWTRGHVLTHVARNADGLANLLRWARTGTQTPMYASRAARDADIEAGAGRGAAALAEDVRDSAAAFAGEAARVPDDAWTVPVRVLVGSPFPAREVLSRRLSEIEIHHVDLAAGCHPRDWPRDFVIASLPRIAGSFYGRDDVPACLLRPDGGGDPLRIGPAGVGVAAEARQTEPGGDGSALTVDGPAWALMAWLLGRSAGDGLTVYQARALPVLPPWR